MKRGKSSFKVAVYRWCRAIEILHELKDNYDDKVLIVAFEDLILNPESNLRRVAAFLGLDFQQEMLEGYKYNWYYPGEEQLNPSKVNRYQQGKTNFELEERFPEICQKYNELLARAR
jgi:hypothetical protein